MNKEANVHLRRVQTRVDSTRGGQQRRVGIDLVPVKRAEKILENEKALARLLSGEEIQRLDAHHVAGRIAAKEAFFKALGISPPRWTEVTVRVGKDGRPELLLNPTLRDRVASCDVSIAHDGGVAIAIVILCLNESTES